MANDKVYIVCTCKAICLFVKWDSVFYIPYKEDFFSRIEDFLNQHKYCDDNASSWRAGKFNLISENEPNMWNKKGEVE